MKIDIREQADKKYTVIGFRGQPSTKSIIKILIVCRYQLHRIKVLPEAAHPMFLQNQESELKQVKL